MINLKNPKKITNHRDNTSANNNNAGGKVIGGPKPSIKLKVDSIKAATAYYPSKYYTSSISDPKNITKSKPIVGKVKQTRPSSG